MVELVYVVDWNKCHKNKKGEICPARYFGIRKPELGNKVMPINVVNETDFVLFKAMSVLDIRGDSSNPVMKQK